jgi:hypothetical protein
MQGINSSPDRRHNQRISSVYRPALIETDEFAGFCLVRNLSSGGMMCSVYTEFAADQPIMVGFNPTNMVEGSIIWSKDGQIGIQFHQQIDVTKLLCALSAKQIGGKLARAPRLPIECDGDLQIEGRLVSISLQDISQRGIKAKVSSMQPGDEVLIRLPGLEATNAIVRWAQSDVAGFNFVHPLSFEQLSTWCIEKQSYRIREK